MVVERGVENSSLALCCITSSSYTALRQLCIHLDMYHGKEIEVRNDETPEHRRHREPNVPLKTRRGTPGLLLKGELFGLTQAHVCGVSCMYLRVVATVVTVSQTRTRTCRD